MGVELNLEERVDVSLGTKVHIFSSFKCKENNIQHIDYDFTCILHRERNQYSRLIDQHFKLRGWSKQMLSEDRMKPIPLGDKVIKI